MQVDLTTLLWTVSVFSILNLGIGYALGHLGFAGISQDVSELKGLIHGQSKITVVPSGFTNVPAQGTTFLPANSRAS